MNNEVIIDGCNVAECKHFEDADCFNPAETVLSCESQPNCLFKQLQRSEQENLRLEAENKKLIDENYELSVNQEDIEQYKTIIQNKNIDIEQLKAENERLNRLTGIYSFRQMKKYKQALEEVREIANKRNVGCGKFCEINRKEHNCNSECNAYYLKQILDKINEVLKDE